MDALRSYLKKAAIRLNYHAGNFRTAVWIVGDGRSGTTWLAELINVGGRYREMFEPFHPVYIEDISEIPLFYYIGQQEEQKAFYEFAHDVFSGRFQHPRVDGGRGQVWYSGLLIKDIFGHLFMAWVRRLFPHLKIILLMRHPFAVALSKEKLRHWAWMTEPKELLLQHNLYHDHLEPFREAIERAETYFEKQVVIWCIIHRVPLSLVGRDDILVLFYEDICIEPDFELTKVARLMSMDLSADIVALAKRPSRVSRGDSAILSGESLVAGWRRELEISQIERGIAILREFGMDAIYSDELLPCREGLTSLLHTPPI